MTAYRITTTNAKTQEVISTEHPDNRAMSVYRRVAIIAAMYSVIMIESQDADGAWTDWETRRYTAEQHVKQRALTKRIEDEKKAVKKIVESAIRLGYMVSLYDGEEYTVKRSTDKAAILAAIYTTDMDKLYFRVKATGEQVGSVTMVYGNSASEVLADWSDCEEVNTILADALAFCDKLSEKGL